MSLELRSSLGRRGGRRSVDVEFGLKFLEEVVVVFLADGRSRRRRRRVVSMNGVVDLVEERVRFDGSGKRGSRRRRRRSGLSVVEEGHR